MSEYTNQGCADNRNDEGHISKSIFEINKDKTITEDVLKEIFISQELHQSCDGVSYEWAFNNETASEYFEFENNTTFESDTQYDTWTETYLNFLEDGNGYADTEKGLDVSVFIELHKQGYINNGLFSNRYYYRKTYYDYYLSNKPMERLIPIKDEIISNQVQIIEALIKGGMIEKIDDESYIVINQSIIKASTK